ncbi:HugZ family protein [Rhodopseudomonas palustris]|uniref:Pyridoxamine 5'-phosphate oxidase-related, FMN-binding n=1 Tax=Rhodopseudomonas palustris (strain BisB18) TaxID=316056 RepID=Q21BR3_RHOPB
MQPTPHFSASELARSLLRRSRQGALATLAVGSGAPYCSLVNLASHWDGSPILLISRLALHTQNLLADPRVSLMLDERAPGDPLEGARIMLSGTAQPATSEELPTLRRRYLNAHPSAEQFVDFGDFSFFVIRPSGAHLVAGFGRIVDLKPQQLLTDLTDAHAFLAEEQGIIAHLNADHLGTMKLYATQLLGARDADATWRCTGCDPDGLDLSDGSTTLRLALPQRTLTAAALRSLLKQLADQARRSNA